MEDALMRKGITLCLALLAAQAFADVAQVNVWSPLPGKGAQLFQNAAEAKPIHEKLGAAVSIAQDQNGNLHYVVSFKNWADYGRFTDAMGTSTEWQQFWQRISEDPTAELAHVFMINNPVVAEPKPVSLVYSWDVLPGNTAAFVAISQAALPIHERLGASIGINIDELGDVHYEMTFDSWEAWGRFQAKSATDQEWTAFLARYNANPIATLTKVWRLNTAQ
jgi:hypothetical protein